VVFVTEGLVCRGCHCVIRFGLHENRKPGSDEEEDDDEAWADMAKKREKKKSSWKMKRFGMCD
jgi:hypothetical protein